MAIIDNIFTIFQFTVPNPISGLSVSSTVSIFDTFSNGTGLQKFQPKDNLRIQSVGVFLPFCFSTSKPRNTISLEWENTNTAATKKVDEISSDSATVNIPEVNRYVELNDSTTPGGGIFIPWASGASWTDPAVIKLTGISVDISLVGVPDDFAGGTREGYVFMKVLHNLPLTA